MGRKERGGRGGRGGGGEEMVKVKKVYGCEERASVRKEKQCVSKSEDLLIKTWLIFIF